MKKLATKIVVGAVFGWGIGALATDATAPAGVKDAVSATVSAEKAVPSQTVTKSVQPTATPAKSEKTEHNFEDLLVQGKYHFSDEAVTTVEEDKVLDSLLGIRTDFKDKIEQSAGRY